MENNFYIAHTYHPSSFLFLCLNYIQALSYITITTIANVYFTRCKSSIVLSAVRDFISLNILIIILLFKSLSKVVPKETFIEKNTLEKGNVSCNF